MALKATEKIWMDGEFVPWGEAKIHVLSHALHYGTGVFEGMRCYDTVSGPAVFRLDDHVNRLFASAHVYMMKIPYSPQEVKEAILETIRVNKVKDCYIRPLAFYGYGNLGVMPLECPVHLIISVWPWGAYLGEDGLKNGIKITISSWVRLHGSMVPVTAKASGHYLNSLLSVMEARSRGYIEGILLDKNGNVSEGSGENIFLVKGGVLFTNDASDSILIGITRNSVIEMARDLGYEVVMKTIAKDELFSADEVFLTGTAAEVTHIREIDGRVIGPVQPGPITKEIQKTFFGAVSGKLERYRKWLTFV